MDDRNLLIVVLLAGIACALSYRVGQRHGADDGWWACMAEHGEVA